MNLTQYQPLALRTEKPLPTKIDRLHHAALGLVTETGEIATEVKRMAIYGKPFDAERRANISEEVGDVMWYMAIAADSLGLQLAGLPAAFEDFDGTPEERAGYVVLGLAGVVGSAASLVGYSFYSGEDLDSNPDQVQKLVSDLINAWRGLNMLATILETTLEEIGSANITKLRERFPDAYSNEAAEARADKGGADARSS